jgi:hypothetical protein
MGRGLRPLPALGPAGLGRQGASPEASFLQAPPLAAAKPPRSQASWAFVLRSLPRTCEGFSLEEKSVVERLPSSNATRLTGRPVAQGSQRESKFRASQPAFCRGNLAGLWGLPR